MDADDAIDSTAALSAARKPYEDTPLLARNDTASSAATPHLADESSPPPPPYAATGWSGLSDFADRPAWRRPSIFWVLPVMLVHTLAFGSLLVPKLTLILELVCRDYFADRALHDPNFVYVPVHFDGSDNEQCDDAVVQKLVTEFMLAFQLITGLASLVTAPRLGALSDRVGRTRVIAFTGLGVFANELITILAANHPETISVNWLLLGAFFDGLSGTFLTAMVVTNAYASDITPPERRVVVFGWVYGMLFTGIALGPFVTTAVLELTGSVLNVFYVALAAHAALIPFILFVVPDSLSTERKRQARAKAHLARSGAGESPQGGSWATRARRVAWGLVETPRQLLAPLAVLWPKGPGSSPALRRNLALLAGIDMVLFGSAMGIGTVVVYYSRFMFHWTPLQSNNFIAAVSVCRVFTVLVAVPLVTRLVRGPARAAGAAPSTGCDPLDVWMIRAGVLLDMLGMAGYASAGTGELFFLAGCLGSFGGMASPTIQSSLTKHAPAAVTGQLLGAGGMLHGAARVVAPLVLNLIYSQTVAHEPRTVFAVLASVFALVLAASFFLRTHVYLHPQEPEATDAEHEDEAEALL